MDLVRIPAGEFWMGQDDGRDEERPARLVWVDAFLLARVPVTNAQYDEFVRATRLERTPQRDQPAFCGADQPVIAVSWFDATAYCAWLSRETGRVFRLPTEAEWERAARGGLERKIYPLGDSASITPAEYNGRWAHGPEPVGNSEPNGFGLLDMCQNVHEWCADWYDPAYYAAAPARSPQGPESGSRRSSRGGAWRHHVKISRCAARSSIPPSFRYEDYGFRVACDK